MPLSGTRVNTNTNGNHHATTGEMPHAAAALRRGVPPPKRGAPPRHKALKPAVHGKGRAQALRFRPRTVGGVDAGPRWGQSGGGPGQRLQSRPVHRCRLRGLKRGTPSCQGKRALEQRFEVRWKPPPPHLQARAAARCAADAARRHPLVPGAGAAAGSVGVFRGGGLLVRRGSSREQLCPAPAAAAAWLEGAFVSAGVSRHCWESLASGNPPHPNQGRRLRAGRAAQARAAFPSAGVGLAVAQPCSGAQPILGGAECPGNGSRIAHSADSLAALSSCAPQNPLNRASGNAWTCTAACWGLPPRASGRCGAWKGGDLWACVHAWCW